MDFFIKSIQKIRGRKWILTNRQELPRPKSAAYGFTRTTTLFRFFVSSSTFKACWRESLRPWSWLRLSGNRRLHLWHCQLVILRTVSPRILANRPRRQTVLEKKTKVELVRKCRNEICWDDEVCRDNAMLRQWIVRPDTYRFIWILWAWSL